MDDAPPPPYSVRDPQSVSPVQPSRPQYITAFNAFVDGAPTPVPGLPIRTPYGQTFVPARYSAPILSPTSRIPQISAATLQGRLVGDVELGQAGFVSAAPYFELRTPDLARPNDKFYHHMSISPNARPDNLPFPQPVEKWLTRGVDSQDWLTFLNHLFPPHTNERSSSDLGQELKADADLDGGTLRLSESRSRDQSRPLLEIAPGMSSGRQDRKFERLRRVRIEAVTSQWNEGFFEPRGLEILVDIVNLASPAIETSRRSSSNVLQKRPPPLMEETLLLQACAKGKKSQVRELLDKGNEDIEAINKKGQTALFIAVSRGDKDVVQILVVSSF